MSEQKIINKEFKKDLAKAIQDLYINTRKFNKIAGNDLSPQRYENQRELVLAELKETNEALKENNLVLLVDGCADLLVTLSELVMILDGNDALTQSPPKYLNKEDRSVEDLLSLINLCVYDGNFIDALGYTEDLTYQLNADMCYNLKSVGVSNMSKFITKTSLELPILEVCKIIEKQGRYTNVYADEVKVDEVAYIVFKSKYDVKNKERYPQGKVLKCPITFQEPDFIVFD